jgi:predicted esterase YcpF (UPF0227 family)
MNTGNKEKININDLADIRDVVINPALNKEERIKSFVNQIKNPLCYKYGDYIVKISFSEDDERTIDRCFEDYLQNL